MTNIDKTMRRLDQLLTVYGVWKNIGRVAFIIISLCSSEMIPLGIILYQAAPHKNSAYT